MCDSGASSYTTSGGLSLSDKVSSLSSRNQGVVFTLSSSRVNIPRNQGTLGSAAVENTPAMVPQVCCTGARVGVGWKIGVPRACSGAVGKAGAGAGGNFIYPCCLIPVVTNWRACVGARLSGAACLVLCWGSRCSLYS